MQLGEERTVYIYVYIYAYIGTVHQSVPLAFIVVSIADPPPIIRNCSELRAPVNRGPRSGSWIDSATALSAKKTPLNAPPGNESGEEGGEGSPEEWREELGIPRERS